MGTFEIQRNYEDGTIAVLHADDSIEVAEQLVQNLDPAVGHIELHIGSVVYRLHGYDLTKLTYQGTKVSE